MYYEVVEKQALVALEVVWVCRNSPVHWTEPNLFVERLRMEEQYLDMACVSEWFSCVGESLVDDLPSTVLGLHHSALILNEEKFLIFIARNHSTHQ